MSEEWEKKGARQGKLQDLSSALQGLLENSRNPLSQQFLRWKVWRHWPEIVGQEISSHSHPVGFHRGRLYVWVDHSARLQEMSFLLRDIVKKVNQHVGKTWVKSIYLTLDKKFVPPSTEKNPNLDKIL